ncbi:hypothetical protein C8Q74DRAFT_1286186 [Fomes fomentarius]|nr:hypothetical protein C8Q74DRAFT_1286186 [Fomes fomentarius]
MTRPADILRIRHGADATHRYNEPSRLSRTRVRDLADTSRASPHRRDRPPRQQWRSPSLARDAIRPFRPTRR